MFETCTKIASVQQLVKYLQDNNIPIIESEEETHVIDGLIQITPQLSIQVYTINDITWGFVEAHSGSGRICLSRKDNCEGILQDIKKELLKGV